MSTNTSQSKDQSATATQADAPLADCQVSQAIKSLRDRFENQPPGNVTIHREEILNLLTAAWDEFRGSKDAAMSTTKLYRIEDLKWNGSELSFNIERHGGTVCGSTRAEIQRWDLNLETLEASHYTVGRRQLRPASKRQDTERLAKEIVNLVMNKAKDARLNWFAPEKVRIEIGKVIPSTNVQTTAARRSRFRGILEHAMTRAGWKLAAGTTANTYQKDAVKS